MTKVPTEHVGMPFRYLDQFPVFENFIYLHFLDTVDSTSIGTRKASPTCVAQPTNYFLNILPIISPRSNSCISRIFLSIGDAFTLRLNSQTSHTLNRSCMRMLECFYFRGIIHTALKQEFYYISRNDDAAENYSGFLTIGENKSIFHCIRYSGSDTKSPFKNTSPPETNIRLLTTVKRFRKHCYSIAINPQQNEIYASEDDPPRPY